jgi:hypothetical protein
VNHGAFTWENYRRSDGTLDVIAALVIREPLDAPAHLRRKARDYLMELEELSSMRNYESASLALAHAMLIVRNER